MRLPSTAAGTLLALLVLVGCGGDGTSEVKGTVKVDGTPVDKGAIQFVPVDGKSPTAGAAITNGEYAAKVPVGLMKVSISAPKVVGKKKLYDTPDSPVTEITKEGLPAKYNTQSELKYEVTAGSNRKDFDLPSK